MPESSGRSSSIRLCVAKCKMRNREIGIQHGVTIGIEIEGLHGTVCRNQVSDLFGFSAAEAEPKETLDAAFAAPEGMRSVAPGSVFPTATNGR